MNSESSASPVDNFIPAGNAKSEVEMFEGGNTEILTATEELKNLKLELKEIVRLSFYFALLWFMSNYFYNYGLAFASITSSVILSNTSPMWVYILGISCIVPVAIRDKFNVGKCLAVVLSLGGFVVIAL